MSEKKQGFFSRIFGGKKEEIKKPKTKEIKEEVQPKVEKTPTPKPAPIPAPEAKKPEAKKKQKQKQKTPTIKKEQTAGVSGKQPQVATKTSKKTSGVSGKQRQVAAATNKKATHLDVTHLDAAPPETTPEWIEKHTPKPKKEKKKSWFSRLSSGLKKSSDNLTSNITSVFTKKKLTQEILDDLEDILIQADLGVDTAISITDTLAKDKFDKEISANDVKEILAIEVEKTLNQVAKPLIIDETKKPYIILMIGVNGSGKTTTIGKLAQKFSDEGKKIMLAAGDTFRAAAIEQLEVWGKRTGAKVISKPAGADASGLAYDAIKQAQKDNVDILIIDTAGRLQNRTELMDELEKIIRVIKKIDESAPHATLLTLDATTGQNALNQVEIFSQKAGVSGLVMTKLDGTARGGILVAIAKKFALPVHYIGIGEKVEDLENFKAKDFAQIIAGMNENEQEEENHE